MVNIIYKKKFGKGVYMRNSRYLTERIFLGIFEKMSNNSNSFKLNKKNISFYINDLMDYFNEIGLNVDILQQDLETLGYEEYKKFLISLVNKYNIGKYIPSSEKILISMSKKQKDYIGKITESIGWIINDSYDIITKQKYCDFVISLIDECDLDTFEISYVNESIHNPIYPKEDYVRLNELVYQYYSIKGKQKDYSSETKKEKIECNKRLREDKKRLTSIANNIIYGYTDLFFNYYYWSKPLMKHYINEVKKDVVVGPTLIKK